MLEYCHSFTSAACVFCSHAPGSSLVYQTPVPSPHELQHTSADVTLGVEGYGSLACCSSRGLRVRHSLVTEQQQESKHNPSPLFPKSAMSLFRCFMFPFILFSTQLLSGPWLLSPGCCGRDVRQTCIFLKSPGRWRHLQWACHIAGAWVFVEGMTGAAKVPGLRPLAIGFQSCPVHSSPLPWLWM